MSTATMKTKSEAMITTAFPFRTVFLFLLFTRTLEAQSQTTTPQTCLIEKDVIFVIDSSLSIRQNNPPDGSTDNWQIILTFLKDIVQELPINNGQIRVGIVPFSTTVDTVHLLPLSNSATAVLNAVDDLVFLGGNTNTSGALIAAENLLSNSGSRTRVIVLVADGLSNVDSNDTLQEARIAKDVDGIQIFAIGLTQYGNIYELEDIVSEPTSYYYQSVQDFNHLTLIVNSILNKLICGSPPPPQPCRDTRADICFMMDASGSIRFQNPDGSNNDSNWYLLTNFMIDVIENLQIGPDATQVAAIRFSYDAEVMFNLNNFTNAAEMVAFIHTIQLVASTTDTQAALRLLMSDVFQATNGARPGVAKVGIIVTDGQSNVDSGDTIPAADAAKSAGVRMFVIGLTNQIDVTELEAMASLPLEDYYFNRTTYALVQTVISQLVWSVCHDPCPNNPGVCTANISNACSQNEHIIWNVYKDHLILGHDYTTLNNIDSAENCQLICLQDYLCRSIDYVESLQQCSVSYYNLEDVPYNSFQVDPYVDYYEWECVANT